MLATQVIAYVLIKDLYPEEERRISSSISPYRTKMSTYQQNGGVMTEPCALYLVSLIEYTNVRHEALQVRDRMTTPWNGTCSLLKGSTEIKPKECEREHLAK